MSCGCLSLSSLTRLMHCVVPTEFIVKIDGGYSIVCCTSYGAVVYRGGLQIIKPRYVIVARGLDSKFVSKHF